MTIFLDTSSLLKLYVEEPGSDEIRQIRDSHSEIAVSALTFAEAHSAMARRLRERSISQRELTKIMHAFDADWFALGKIPASDSIIRKAGHLCHKLSLRALDAIQLASALFIADFQEEPVLFISADKRLEAAARREKLRTQITDRR